MITRLLDHGTVFVHVLLLPWLLVILVEYNTISNLLGSVGAAVVRNDEMNEKRDQPDMTDERPCSWNLSSLTANFEQHTMKKEWFTRG
jgi:hypothetical protein